MKSELTIDQSARLIELGVDPKLASKHKVRVISDSKGLPLEKNKIKKWSDVSACEKATYSSISIGLRRFEYVDIFTLTDILAIFPKEIGRYNLTIDAMNGRYDVTYQNYNPYTGCDEWMPNKDITAPELIDALYQLLCWVIEQGYYKPSFL